MLHLLHTIQFFLICFFGISLTLYIHVTYLLQLNFAKYFTSPPSNGSSYDFIVVGSGSAGSAVVGRLAEAGHSVLLLEAGGPSHFLSGVPAFPIAFVKSPYAWRFLPDLENNVGASKDSLEWPRGKVLGGSSILNWMFYTRGHSKDYDSWAEDGARGEYLSWSA